MYCVAFACLCLFHLCSIVSPTEYTTLLTKWIRPSTRLWWNNVKPGDTAPVSHSPVSMFFDVCVVMQGDIIYTNVQFPFTEQLASVLSSVPQYLTTLIVSSCDRRSMSNTSFFLPGRHCCHKIPHYLTAELYILKKCETKDISGSGNQQLSLSTKVS